MSFDIINNAVSEQILTIVMHCNYAYWHFVFTIPILVDTAVSCNRCITRTRFRVDIRRERKSRDALSANEYDKNV